MVVLNSEGQVKAREILAKKIENGRASAMALFNRVNEEAPRDLIAKGRALEFGSGAGLGVNMSFQGVTEEGFSVHKHALSQLAHRAGIPSQYLGDLSTGVAWERELAAHALNKHYNAGNAGDRYLVRTVKDQVRGFLSDRYRRLDSRPLVEAFATECQKIGAEPVDGTFSDTRVALKAIIPQIYEPVPGEVLAFGVEWANSDFGNGTHAVRAFMLRVWCLNGATMENALSQIHLGRQLGDDIELSKRTYELDTRTSVSALRDVVAATLAPRKIEALCAGIAKANEDKVEWKNVKGGLAKKLLKGELQAAEAAFESADVYNLPPGNTMWRVSNAVSWIAGQKDVDSDRKLELQRLAGQLVDGRGDRAEAA